MTEAYDKVQLLRGKLSDWFTINPILDEGEAAVVFDTETDVPIGIKVGNGKLHFRDLPFMGAGSFTTYTKEEIDDLFEESNKKIGILQVKVDALYQIIPSSATPDNKLITLKELTESGSSLQKIIGELTQNKLDKNVEVTTLDQAYIKKADGTQALMDISNETAESSSGIAARRAGRIKTRRAFENDDAVNKEDLQAIKSDLDTKKLDKIAVTDNNEYAYLQDKTSSKLGRVSDDIISGVIVKRTPAGTIKSTKATQAGETVILEQLQDVSADLDAHKKDVSNPHKVTRAQVGLGNVDNTSDLSKPISTATQNALNAKQKTIPGISSSAGFVLQPPISDGGNPVRKDIKYFASATDLAREALLREQADDNKVDKKKGYDLSQNDFTDAIKETYDETVKKVSGIAPNAQVNVLEKIVLFGNEVPVINKRVILSGIAQSKDLQAEETSRIQADEKLDGAIKANTKNITDESTIREEADNAISDRIDKIDDVIPEQASKINQLADKDFVNSSIATNTATFWGTFVSADDLKAEATKPGKNDYANVRTTDDEGNYIFTRFKYAGKTVDDHTQYDPTKWEYEYTVNSSGFTAEQWAAINSGITATLRGQITLNTSAIEKNVNAIGQLKTNKVDSETYNNGLENLKTDLEAEIATKEREASLQISDWFNLAENVWAKNAGVNVPLQEIVNKSYDDEFYKNYIDNLRRLNKGSQVPFDINSWANILAHEDSSEDIWIFSQKKGLFYIISVDDTSKEIKFTERPLYSLATLDDLSETKDQIDNELKLYVQKSDKAVDLEYRLAVYDGDGKLLPSDNPLSSISNVNLTTERWKAIRYVKGSEDLGKYYGEGKIYLDRGEENPQTPKNEIYSGITYIDVGETSGNVIFAQTDEAYLTDIKLPTSVNVSLCRSTGVESSFTLENSSLSSLLFSAGAKDSSEVTVWAPIDDAAFINCNITLNSPAGKQDGVVSKVYRLSNSTVSVNTSTLFSDKSLSATLTFDKVEYSRIDIDDEVEADSDKIRYIFKDVTSSVVYLHHNARIQIDAETDDLPHTQELEIVLCADYNSAARIAIGDVTCPFTGTGRPIKITDLRKPVYTSRSYVAVIVEDDKKGFQNLPKQVWSSTPDTAGEYSAIINYNTHRCGSMPDLYNSELKLNYFFPKVKTYSLVNGAIFEEVYDSAQIDINSGNVMLRSKSRTPTYLVVIS